MILSQLKTSPETLQFKEVISYIDHHYIFTPSKFTNGGVVNESGQNNGSCKIFSFGKIHHLSESELLHLFGEIYRGDVLNNPNGHDHQNIRNFIKFGWDGILFESEALKKKENVIE
ncbi:HopJ type III effector protein [Chryseobacterium sp.]|uniref:HopJ type III effector protein n=1 Tax=Chryseobacterium sp. TaxID=1871047 RepID=UPI0011C7162B|nr:HopJ type III effector protein [Chryseobacterium sp.]TXF77684.1 HopJ type III effector protein [Chryseobacterium sp.]